MEFTEMQAQEAARSAGIDLEKERFDLKALTADLLSRKGQCLHRPLLRHG